MGSLYIYIYIYIYIQRITMCPHGYHHSGSMATPHIYIYGYIYKNMGSLNIYIC